MRSESQFPNDRSCSTRDELTDRRAAALRKAEDKDVTAAEAGRQSEMYILAAVAAGERAFQANARAKHFEAKGEATSAAEQRNLAAELRATRDKNYQIADAKGRQAMEHKREAFNARSLALRLDVQLKKKGEHRVTAYRQATNEKKGSSAH